MIQTQLYLPTRRIQTAKSDLFYDVPFNPEGRTFSSIPKTFLSARLNYSIGRFRDRIAVALSKHGGSRHNGRDGSRISENIDELEEEIRRAIEAIPGTQIRNSEDQRRFCAAVSQAVRRFKSDRERNIDVGQKVAEIFFQIERDVIVALFRVPERSENINHSLNTGL